MNNTTDDEPKTDPLLESDPKSMLAMAQGSTEIARWSDTKKTEFVGTFRARTQVARYLLERTAFEVLQTAMNRKFIGGRHMAQVLGSEHHGRYDHTRAFDATRFTDAPFDRYHTEEIRIGGREQSDLNKIAGERALEVLSNLPPLRQAVQVIDPDAAKMLDRIDALKKQGEALAPQIEEASEPILASEVDQNMTIGDFRKLVRDQDKKRKNLLTKLHEIGREGSDLEVAVSKKLYRGLPGLSDAVVAVAKAHFERSTALDEVGRRVEEQVKFGDSDAATTLLRHFEQDEAQISDNVKAQFAEALTKLKLSVKPKKVSKKAKELRA